MHAASLDKSIELVDWLGRQIGGTKLDGALRTRVVAVCFGVAQEHHSSIVALLARDLPLVSSAFTLARPLFEAYTRGMWLALCASDEQIDRYLKGKIPDMASLISAIQKLQTDGEVSSLAKVYQNSWKGMSGLTHTGAEHFERWSLHDVLEPAFSADDIGRMLDFAARVGTLSCLGIAMLSTDDAELWKRVAVGAKTRSPPRYSALASAPESL